MSLYSFAPSDIIASAKLNANFEGLSDGSLIQNGAIDADHISAQEAWIAPTLLNSWANYGASYDEVGYMKDHLGFVHIKGLLKDGSPTTSTMFELPAGYRPLGHLIFANFASGGLVRINVLSDGSVNASTGASASYTSISGIVFKAEQ